MMPLQYYNKVLLHQLKCITFAKVITMSTVTSKGQTTIPKHIRELLNIIPGETNVDFFVIDGNVQLVNQDTYNPFQKVLGITKGRMSTDEIMKLTRGR